MLLLGRQESRPWSSRFHSILYAVQQLPKERPDSIPQFRVVKFKI